MNYYEILRISPGATPAEIKQAYYKLAPTCHPDKFPNDAEKAEQFRQINEAYQLLSDPIERSKFDKTLEKSAVGFTIADNDYVVTSEGSSSMSLVVRKTYNFKEMVISSRLNSDDLKRMAIENSSIALAICDDPELIELLSLSKLIDVAVVHETVAQKLLSEATLLTLIKGSYIADHYLYSLAKAHSQIKNFILENPELKRILSPTYLGLLGHSITPQPSVTATSSFSEHQEKHAHPKSQSSDNIKLPTHVNPTLGNSWSAYNFLNSLDETQSNHPVELPIRLVKQDVKTPKLTVADISYRLFDLMRSNCSLALSILDIPEIEKVLKYYLCDLAEIYPLVAEKIVLTSSLCAILIEYKGLYVLKSLARQHKKLVFLICEQTPLREKLGIDAIIDLAIDCEETGLKLLNTSHFCSSLKDASGKALYSLANQYNQACDYILEHRELSRKLDGYQLYHLIEKHGEAVLFKIVNDAELCQCFRNSCYSLFDLALHHSHFLKLILSTPQLLSLLSLNQLYFLSDRPGALELIQQDPTSRDRINSCRFLAEFDQYQLTHPDEDISSLVIQYVINSDLLTLDRSLLSSFMERSCSLALIVLDIPGIENPLKYYLDSLATKYPLVATKILNTSVLCKKLRKVCSRDELKKLAKSDANTALLICEITALRNRLGIDAMIDLAITFEEVGLKLIFMPYFRSMLKGASAQALYTLADKYNQACQYILKKRKLSQKFDGHQLYDLTHTWPSHIKHNHPGSRTFSML